MSLDKSCDILFICGALQPGADGIGDYTRRLATELTKQGFVIRMLAYSDRHINSAVNEVLSENNQNLHVLRLPKLMHAKEKSILIRDWMGEVNPNWVSLQYVLYAFSDKGLPFAFASELNSLFPLAKYQIMFHELWLGMERKPLLKDKIFGVMQSLIISNMIKRLKPQVIHTHSRAYLKLLNHHGYQAKWLPIISNIPVMHPERPYVDISNKQNLKFLVFGFISPGAPIESFANELKAFADDNSRQVEILFAGRNGAHDHDWHSAFKQAGIPYAQLGVLDVESLSDLMNDCDIGISTTPFQLYEKSGSVAAMFKHGLPVLNVAVSWDPEIEIQLNVDEPITEYKPGMLSAWLLQLHKPGRKNRLENIAHQFADDLNLNLVKH